MTIWQPLHKSVILGREPRNSRGSGRSGGGGGGPPGRGGGGGGGGGGKEGGKGTGGAIKLTNAFGSCVTMTATMIIVSGSAPLTWGQANWDKRKAWSASAPTRLTVPKGVSYVRLTGGLYWSESSLSQRALSLQILKDGSAVEGGGRVHLETAGDCVMNVESGVLQVSEGEYFELVANNGGSEISANNLANTFFSMEFVKVDDGSGTCGDFDFCGAMIRNSTDHTVANATTTELDHDTDVYDTDDIHDTVSDTENLVPPAASTYVRLSGVGQWDSDATLGGRNHWFARNSQFSTAIVGGARATQTTTGDTIMNMFSAVIEVPVPGTDYYSVYARQLAGNDLNDNSSVGRNWAAMEVVNNFQGGALVVNSGAQTIGHNSQTIITFDTDVYDTDDIHDTVSNTSRLVVPPGVSWIKLNGSLRWASDDTDDDRGLQFYKNGSTFNGAGGANFDLNLAYDVILQISSGVIEVSPGDYFELAAYHFGGGDLDTNDTSLTFLSMELLR